MKVFVEYTVCLSALVEKEVPPGTEYDDIVESITRDDLLTAEVQPADWDAIKSAEGILLGHRGEPPPRSTKDRALR